MKIRINNKIFFFFNNFAIERSLDSVASVFSFVARFNPQNPEHRTLFRPGAYPKIEIFSGDDKLLLTGKIVNYDFNSTQNPELVKLSGYSLGGELEDCNIPYSAYSLESNNRNLREIFERLLKLFNIELIVDPSAKELAESIYVKSIASPTESIKSYLAKLAAQRNIVLSHDSKGRIILFKPDLNKGPALSVNKTNAVTMSMSFNGQSFHSEISVLRQPSSTNKNLTPVDTVKNILIQSFRPKVKTLSSGTDTDTIKSAENELAAELSSFYVTLFFPKIYDLTPGDIVEVENDEIFLYEKTKFILSSITINEDESKTTTTMNLVLPQSFTGEQPKNIFK